MTSFWFGEGVGFARQVVLDHLDYFLQLLLETRYHLVVLQLDGVLQVASFHPQYQFAGSEREDLSNATNRSPYPTLHLIREESIDRAVEAFAQAERIFENNIATLEQLGAAGWEALLQKCRADAARDAPG